MDRSQDGLRQLLHDLESLFEGDRSLGVCAPAMVAGSGSFAMSGFILPDARPSPPVATEPERSASSATIVGMLEQVLVNQARILDRLDRLEHLART